MVPCKISSNQKRKEFVGCLELLQTQSPLKTMERLSLPLVVFELGCKELRHGVEVEFNFN